MIWEALTLISVSAAVVLHLRWRNRLRHVAEAHQKTIRALNERQETEALQGQAKQQAVFDSMVEGLLLLDRQGRVELANSAFSRLFGVHGDIHNRSLLEAVRIHQIADVVNQLTRDKPMLETELRLPDRVEKFVQLNAAAVFDQAHERAGTILVFHDVTRIRQLESARKDFVANVSHELRTPLSLIKGWVETLLDGAKDNPELATKFLKIIDRNAERLKLLMDDVLTISELESGKVNLKLEPVSLQEVVRKVLNDFKAAAGVKRISLEEQTPPLRVMADPIRLEQVLCNLVDNAVKYGRMDGKVIVGARALDTGQVEAIVRDDGPGIPEEAVERVFERFYRVDKGRSREQGGTGLGLSIVKHIVQSHGGKAWVTSQIGCGAVFHFTLPGAGAPASSARAAPPNSADAVVAPNKIQD